MSKRILSLIALIVVLAIASFSSAQEIIPIADIQGNPSSYEGQTVTIEGVVTIGVGVTNDGSTNSFIQDDSGRGIMLYDSDIVYESELVRANLVQVTGTVTEYNDVTEITDFTVTVLSTNQPIPDPMVVTTGDADDAGGNYIYDGTLIQTTGEIVDLYEVGGGTNVGLDDGSGEARFRVWSSTGIDLSELSMGDQATLIGVGNAYNNRPQYLPGYQDHINPDGGDGVSITNVSHSPANPQDGEAVTVTATITSDVAIDVATLYYSIDSGTPTGTAMSLQSGDVYEGTIPGQTEGAEVSYNIEAVDDDGNEATSSTYSYTVGGGGGDAIPIADIQGNPSSYEGQTVTIEGVVTIGVGVTNDGSTNSFIQDDSGRGIMLYDSDIVYETELVRANLVQVTGTVTEYNDVTEITDFTVTVLSTNQPIPDPMVVTTGDADDAGGNYIYDGTLIQTTGEIVDLYEVGGGTNVGLDDGSGEVRFRVWSSTGIDLSELSMGDQATLIGVGNAYNNRPQYLPGYQDQINPEDGGDGVSITNVSHTPANPQDGEAVTVTATITSDVAIDVATLYYSIDSGTPTGTAMSLQSGDVYEGTIPGQTEGAEVSYNIEAVDDDGNEATSSTYSYTVGGGGGDAIPIADIQGNPSSYEGQTVTIEGVVTIGVGVTNDGSTNSFIQDNSGRGVMLYDSDIVYETELVRANLVQVTGTVTEYNDVTEITDFTVTVLSTNQPIPDPMVVTTGDADDADGNYIYDGTLIQTTGEIVDLYEVGGGTNVGLDDGSGEVRFRVWSSTGIDLSELSMGDQATLIGVGNAYNNRPQYLPGYQDHINPDGGDGVSITNVSHSPTTPEENEAVTVTATITADAGISEATLSYAVDSGAYTEIAMSVQSGDIYEATIPGQADEAQVQYYIEAMDSDGNEKTSTTYSYIVGGGDILPIATIQGNPSSYDGQEVTIQGVITVGVGVTNDQRTNAFIQDNSGRGVMLYDSGIVYETELVRGNLVQVTGTVTEYNDVTEITDFTLTVLSTNQPIPDPLEVTTDEADNAGGNFIYDGTLIQATGEVVDFAENVGGGANIGIDDGTGEARFRVWESTGIDLSGVAMGEIITIIGVGSVYNDQPQYLPAYQDHIIFGQIGDPTISNVYHEPVTPDEDQPVSVYASVVSEYDLNYVRLMYDVNSGNEQTIDMTTDGDDIYTAEIPGQAMQSIITYYIQAENSNGDVTTTKVYSYIVGDYEYLPIASIRNNMDAFLGKEVTIQAVVTVGAGVIRDDMLSAYVQDESGTGINIFDYDLNNNFVRGNLLTITGELELYNDVLELKLADTDSTVIFVAENQPLPTPESISIGALKKTMEGTFLQVEGVVEEMFEAGGGLNVTLRDVTGATTVRVWNTTGVDMSDVEVGDRLRVQGIGSVYESAPQILLCYQDDFNILGDQTFDDVSVGISVYQGSSELFDQNKPFAPDMGEFLVFEVKSPDDYRLDLEVYDLEGRMVKSLLKNYPGGYAQISWDGTDNYMEKVDIGMYLLLLDYRDADGDIHRETEIIVVGTPLK